MRLTVAAIFVSLMIVVCAWARPAYISCPIDGAPMQFDHQVGYDAHAVCWYSHWTYETKNGMPERVKHEDHVLCSDQ